MHGVHCLLQLGFKYILVRVWDGSDTSDCCYSWTKYLRISGGLWPERLSEMSLAVNPTRDLKESVSSLVLLPMK